MAWVERFEDKPEYQRGDVAQREWARLLEGRGSAIVTIYDNVGKNPEDRAPTMSFGGRRFVTPDVQSIRAGRLTWHEVKGKTRPTFYRNLGQWEHGFDFSLLEEYAAAERVSGSPVWVVVHETRSPRDIRRGPDMSDKSDDGCRPSNLWLVAPLQIVRDKGRHRREWPKRNGNPLDRGRHGMGGLLWPRDIMKIIPATSKAETGAA